MESAFSTVFLNSQWQNDYQLHQAINYPAGMYGFTSSFYGNKIYCSCGRSHQRKNASTQPSPVGFVAPTTKKRSQDPLSDLMCPMCINFSPAVPHTKGKGIGRGDCVLVHWNAYLPNYRNELYYGDNGEVTGHEIIYNAGEGVGIRIPIGGRCPKDSCIADDIQCVHEMVNDNDFITEKWGTIWWKNKMHRQCFGDGHHLPSPSSFTTDMDLIHNGSEDLIDCGNPDDNHLAPLEP